MRSGWRTPCVSRSGVLIVRRESPNSCGGRRWRRARIITRMGEDGDPAGGGGMFIGIDVAKAELVVGVRPTGDGVDRRE